jgi:peptidyl-dipeptidase A
MAFEQFVDQLVARVAPLHRDMVLAKFEASVSGQEADYARAAELELELKAVYGDREAFARLERWREAGTVTDPLLARQLEVLHSEFLANQLPQETLTRLVELQSSIEQRFNTHRATIDGAEVSDNQLAEILRTSTDSAELEKAWYAAKEIGPQVADDVIELVKLRNQAAQSLGFANFHAMKLALGEQDPAEIEALFDELDRLTRDEFVAAKAEIDAYLAARLGLDPAELRPWHYQNPFFQEAPAISEVDLDAYYRETDPVQLTEDYYAGIGLPVGELIATSDLYEKPGKYQHAFCEDIDREGDVRVLASVRPNVYWMNTMLHEYGHAVYDRYNDRQVPWLLRVPAHAFTTEAIANMFGRFASHPDWLHDMVGITAEERDRIRDAAAGSLRLEQLLFSRWSQVMFRFEKALYENPDQDLNTLWWDLVEKYQLLTRPGGRDQPDWAAKIHIALYPAYYHNYLMGELLASQLYHHIGSQVLHADDVYRQSFVGREEVGEYLREAVFEPGKTQRWSAMIEAATGEPLTPLYYAQQFITGSAAADAGGPHQEM